MVLLSDILLLQLVFWFKILKVSQFDLASSSKAGYFVLVAEALALREGLRQAVLQGYYQIQVKVTLKFLLIVSLEIFQVLPGGWNFGSS